MVYGYNIRVCVMVGYQPAYSFSLTFIETGHFFQNLSGFIRTKFLLMFSAAVSKSRFSSMNTYVMENGCGFKNKKFIRSKSFFDTYSTCEIMYFYQMLNTRYVSTIIFYHCPHQTGQSSLFCHNITNF